MAKRPKRLSAEAISVLESMAIDGKVAKITGGQLERSLYVEVNAALMAIGGMWNRKLQGHVFTGDPRDAIEQVAMDGEFCDQKRDFDAFYTPREVADEMAEWLELAPRRRVLEPSCGGGSLIETVQRIEPTTLVYAFEIRPEVAAATRERLKVDVACDDFLTSRLVYNLPKFDRVIMNPPFSKGQEIEHVKHAHSLLAPRGRLISVMSAGVDFRLSRSYVMFRDWVRGLGGTIEPMPEQSFKSSGTNVRTVMVRIINGGK